MTVEGLHKWPQWRVTAKFNKKKYGSLLVVAPNGRDAVEAAQQHAAERWGWPDQIVWTVKRAGEGTQLVVHYV